MKYTTQVVDDTVFLHKDGLVINERKFTSESQIVEIVQILFYEAEAAEAARNKREENEEKLTKIAEQALKALHDSQS